MAEVHVVGAGLAGLSTALHLASRGVRVRLHEASGHAGGRCRSYDDARLGRRIDNGNHLVLSGNRSTRAYMALAGSPDAMRAAEEAAFPFVDLAAGERWTVRLNRGRLPWWIASPARRTPGTSARDHLGALRLARARPEQTVAQAIPGRGPIWQRFWEPLTLAILNDRPERGSARLLWRVFAETVARGGAHCRPMVAPDGLGAALVDPALARLGELGAAVRLGRPLRALERSEGRVAVLVFDGERIALGPADRVVLALPPSRLSPLMPELDLPDDAHPILNLHVRVEDAPALVHAPPLTGVLGARAQWVFVRRDVVSITVSAPDRQPADEEARRELVDRLWAETKAALGLGGARMAAHRLLVEKRATFDQSPAALLRRPRPQTALGNLILAGDVTDTGLPATIEGAIRSGETAARLAAPDAAGRSL
ncbi:MAG TPA: hydroxysqualene dehydroxylase HpnE [Thermohalobaculum sp.]|nr:hydroxysqualene dehydroxylase HpnE [Thermohalobaculum sp.]